MSLQPHRKRVLDFFPKNSTGVEIGVFKGDFSANILSYVNARKLYLVDPWENFDEPDVKESWYHASSKFNMEHIHKSVVSKFSDEISEGRVEILRGKSCDVMDAIPPASLDFAYVDGDHRFEAVLQDLEICAPKVKRRGVVVLDDHQLGNWWGDGVIRALNTFLGRYPADWRVRFIAQSQVGIMSIRQPD